MSNGARCPRDGLEGEQRKVNEEQEHVEHSEVDEAKEKPLPRGQGQHAPAQEESDVRHSSTEQGQQKTLTTRRTKKKSPAQWEEYRRKRNMRRLEEQRLEFERKCEARKKANEGATTAAAASSSDAGDDAVSRVHTGNKGEPEEHSKPVELQSSRRNEEALQARSEGGQQPPAVEDKMKRSARARVKKGKSSRAAGKADGQKVNTEDDAAAELLRRDADAASSSLEITNGEEHFVSSLTQPTSSVSSPAFSPVTPHSVWAFPSLGCGDVCGLHEDAQTTSPSDYLFYPLPRGVTVPTNILVEGAQTREDAVEVLFEPPLERSGYSTGTFIPKVKICHDRLPTYHPRNAGVSRSTRAPQRGRVRGWGPHWHGRGGRGPRDELS